MNVKLIAALTAIALVAPAGAAQPLLDQLDNGDFEAWEDSDPAEWRTVQGEVTPTNDAYEGETAAMLNAGSENATTTLAQEVSLDNDDLLILPTATYEVGFAADLHEGLLTDPTDAPEGFAEIHWQDASGETVHVDQVEILNLDGYQEYNATFTAPADATAADIQFQLVRESVEIATSSSLKVDAATFGPIT